MSISSIGSFHHNFGGGAGLPLYFTWSSPDQVDLSRLIHKSLYPGKTLRWRLEIKDDADADQLRRLREAFVLSDGAKMFGAALELMMMREHQPVAFTVTCMVASMAAIALARGFDVK